MKKLLIIALFITGISFPEQAKSQVSVSVQLFYDQLSPYGIWVNNPSYGYVWVPNAGPNFRPYETDGYWVYSEAGWTWVSNYSWGWAPFHYGRWYYDSFYGNVWIPGNEWGPAWVSWRRCDGYYGWVPLGPGISYGPTYVSYNPPPERWVFVREQDFGQPSLHTVDRSSNPGLMNRSTVIQNTSENRGRRETYISGPDRAEVQKTSGRTINPVVINENAKPGVKMNNDKLMVYRPRVENNAAASKPAPAKVYTANEAKPILEKRGAMPANAKAAPVNRANEKPVTPTTGPRDMNRTNKMNPGAAEKKASPDVNRTDPRIRNNQPVQAAPQNNTRPMQPRQENLQQPQRQERLAQPREINPAPQQRMREEQREMSPPPQQQRMEQPREISPPPQQQRMEQPRQMSPPPQQQMPPPSQPMQQPRNMGGQGPHGPR